MKSSRLLQPLFLAFALLFAQQGGAAHALSHALEQTRQQDKQAPHSPACEQCETYAQLSSALNVGTYDFALAKTSGEQVQQRAFAFQFIHVFAAAARGPPAYLQKTA